MKKLKRFLSASKINSVAFVLMVSLVLYASVGAAQAAVGYLAETYAGGVTMYDIGVTLCENGNSVTWRDYGHDSDDEWDETSGILLLNMLDEGEGVTLGKPYPEELSVYNSGTIDEYVRVSIYRYWEDENGNKAMLDPSLIDLNILTGGNGWILDQESSTAERTVLYYQTILEAGYSTPPFSDILTISSEVGEQKTRIGEYVYKDARFIIRVDVDAVQTHNASDAIKSAWGINMDDFGIH